MRAVTALLACAIGCSTARPPVAVEPAAEDTADRPPESRLGRFLLAASSAGERMARRIVPVRDVPRVDVPPMLDPEQVADEPPADSSIEHLMTLGFAEVRGFSWTVPWHQGDYDPVYLACGETRKNLQAVRAEGLLRSQRGDVGYRIVDRVYDTELCTTRGTPRITEHAMFELLAGVAFAFRTCDDAKCKAGQLSVILPPAVEMSTSRSRATDPRNEARNALSRATFPLPPGGSETVVARIGAGELQQWLTITSPNEPPPPETDLVVGVELSQTERDEEAVLLVYVTPASPATPPARP